jgi:putative addiction module component (TIGR02574 family)
MRKEAARVLEEALTLTTEERAKLAAELLASLDHEEENIETAWAAEIARRAEDARNDPEDEEDWRTALADVQREVLSR